MASPPAATQEGFVIFDLKGRQGNRQGAIPPRLLLLRSSIELRVEKLFCNIPFEILTTALSLRRIVVGHAYITYLLLSQSAAVQVTYC